MLLLSTGTTRGSKKNRFLESRARSLLEWDFFVWGLPVLILCHKMVNYRAGMRISLSLSLSLSVSLCLSLSDCKILSPGHVNSRLQFSSTLSCMTLVAFNTDSFVQVVCYLFNIKVELFVYLLGKHAIFPGQICITFIIIFIHISTFCWG